MTVPPPVNMATLTVAWPSRGKSDFEDRHSQAATSHHVRQTTLRFKTCEISQPASRRRRGSPGRSRAGSSADRCRSCVAPSPLAQRISMSRPPSCAASRIDWRQPPHGVTDAAAGQLAARPVAAGDRDPRDLVEPEGGLGRGQRADLGADAEPVAGILHVGAGDDLAVDALDRAADREAGVRRIGAQARRRARRRSVASSCHGYCL